MRKSRPLSLQSPFASIISTTLLYRDAENFPRVVGFQHSDEAKFTRTAGHESITDISETSRYGGADDHVERTVLDGGDVCRGHCLAASLQGVLQNEETLICALLAIAMACLGTALYAQDNDDPGPRQMGQGGARRPASHANVSRPAAAAPDKELNLSADQQQKIKPMLEQEQQQMQTLHQDTSMSQVDRMSKMQQIRQGTNDQIKSVLTSDQQTKFMQMQDRHGTHGPGYGPGRRYGPRPAADFTPAVINFRVSGRTGGRFPAISSRRP